MALNRIGQVLKKGVATASQAIDSLKEQGKEKIAESIESVKTILPLLVPLLKRNLVFFLQAFQKGSSARPRPRKYFHTGEAGARFQLQAHPGNTL